MVRSPLKPLSKKRSLYDWVIDHFPENYASFDYFDACASTGNILLNKDRSDVEVINDKDVGLTNILKALRDDSKTFVRRLKHYKYCPKTFQNSLEEDLELDYFDAAIKEYIARQMSLSGKRKSFNVKGEESWKRNLDQLKLLAERLQNVSILCHDFKGLLKIWDEEKVFVFLDPPSLPISHEGTIEEGEMAVEEHLEFLNIIKKSKSKIMLFSQDYVLYTKALVTEGSDWKVYKNKIKEERYCIWVNYHNK